MIEIFSRTFCVQYLIVVFLYFSIKALVPLLSFLLDWVVIRFLFKEDDALSGKDDG